MIKCNCYNVCRVPFGTLPISNHISTCEYFKQEIFIKVCYNGTCIIVEEENKDDYNFEDTTKEEILLTRDQFEKLPEGEF